MDGEAQIKEMMIDLRENPLSEINGEKIVLIEDYQSSEAKIYRIIPVSLWISQNPMC